MILDRPVILIGSLTREVGAISTITKAFIEDLQGKYNFVTHSADRRLGNTSLSNFNAINLYYFFKHLGIWICELAAFRPDIAHYPITSYWNLEKSMIFLKVASIFGCKTIGHLHGGAFIDFWSTLPRIRKIWAFKQLNKLDAFIVLSGGWKERIISKVGISNF